MVRYFNHNGTSVSESGGRSVFVSAEDYAALCAKIDQLQVELGETRLVLEQTERNAERLAAQINELRSALTWLHIESGGKAIPNSSLDAARNCTARILSETQIASPAGEKIRSAQDEAMEPVTATGQPPVGAVSHLSFIDTEDRSGEAA